MHVCLIKKKPVECFLLMIFIICLDSSVVSLSVLKIMSQTGSCGNKLWLHEM